MLPDSLPDEPLQLLSDWLNEARRLGAERNPDAMVLSTADARGRPSSRVVLCKQLERDPGCAIFYTNYRSEKAVDMDAMPLVSCCFYWDSAGRQARLAGSVVRLSEAENDAYFDSRDKLSQLGAWASDQTQPLASRTQLMAQLDDAARRFGIDPKDPERDPDARIPRPPHWGGYRIWIDTVELWTTEPGRLHDRARWCRSLDIRDDEIRPGSDWSSTRLQP